MNSKKNRFISGLLSFVMMFTLVMQVLPPVMVHAADGGTGGLKISSPSDGATINGFETVKIKWNRYSGADHYLLVVKDETTGQKVFEEEVSYSTSSTRTYNIYSDDEVFTEDGHEYKIYVVAMDENDDELNNGAAWHAIYVDNELELETPEITSHGYLDTHCIDDTLYVEWDPVDGADNYTVYVKKLNGEPDYGSSNESGTNITYTWSDDCEIKVATSKLVANKWYKIALCATNTDQDIDSEWTEVYILMEESSYLNVSEYPDDLDAAKGSTGSFWINSNLDWDISCDVSWLTWTINQVDDTHAEIIVKATTANTGTSDREAEFTISADGVDDEYVYVTQLAPEIELPSFSNVTISGNVSLGEKITWSANINGNGALLETVSVGIYSKQLDDSVFFRNVNIDEETYSLSGSVTTGGIVSGYDASGNAKTLDMSLAGEYTVTIHAATDAAFNNYAATEPVMIVLSEPENIVLDKPNMTAPDFYGIYEAGQDVKVLWETVNKAEYYAYEIFDITNGLPGELIMSGTTEDKQITISGNKLLANHVIEIYLTANTYNGAISEKTFNCIVIGASEESISASDEEIIISSAGGSDTITVYSSGEWTARKSDSWFSINKTSGDGEETLSITAEKNTTSEIRIGSIKLQDGTGEYYVIVQQAAKASSDFYNKIRVIFDSNSLTISEDDIFSFSGSAYNTEVDLDKIHVSITKADEPDVGIDYFRYEAIGDSVFDFSDIPSFYANEILEGLMVTNTQSSLTLVPGESYHINIWVTDEDGYSSGKIQKLFTISESVKYNIAAPIIDQKQLTNTGAYIEATILETGVNSISDYGFNILTQSGDRYQQYSLWQTEKFKDVSYNKKTSTFSINASDLEAGTDYYVEAFIIDSEGNTSFSDRADFTTKSAGVTITKPANNEVYAADATSIEFEAEVVGSGYTSTTFNVYDYDMNVTGYVFTSSGSTPSATWNISSVDKGTYYVQAETLLDDGSVTCSGYIKFDLYIPVSSITIKDDGSDTITVGEGEQRKVTATVTPSYATNKKISWSTNNKNIATVDKYGVVSGISDGTTVLVAKDETGNVIDSCTLVITQEAPDIEELDEFEFSMGDTTDSAVLVGPTIEFGGESFSLFEFPLNFDIPGTLWAFKTKYNEDTETVQLILGKEVCTSIEQNVGDSDAYWKETYAQLKDMMNSYGMKTSRDFYNKFRKLKSDIRNNSPLQKANLGFEFDTELYGYIELNKNLEFVEGAIVLALSTELSVSYPLPPAPVVSIVFSIAADAQGKLMLVPRTAYYSGYDLKGELSLGITPGIAANIDVKAAEAEAKIDATLQFNMDLPLKSLEESLTISIVNAKLTLSYQMLKFINGEKIISLGDDIQLYPNTSAYQLMTANTFAMIQEEIDNSSDMQLIDTRNSVSTYGRMLFALNSGINEVFSKVKDEMIDDTVYCYEPVDIVQLDDGREFAVWVKTDTERNVANETTLYWSTKKNGVWETPKKIHDDGTADFKPILAKTSDGNVHLIWQNSVKEFDEDVTLDEMGAYTELYHSVFNGIAFSTPTMITTNTDVMCNLVEVNTYGNDVIVAWSESNIETDTSTVKYITYSSNNWSLPQVVVNNVAIVEDLASGYTNTEPVVAVKYDNDPLNTDSESILAYYKNGALATIDNSADACNGLYIIDGVIYYLDNNVLQSYNGTNILSEDITVPDNVSNYQLFVNDSGTSYILYTVSSGKYNNIFTHARELNGEWTSAVQITDYDMKLYSIAGILNNDELDVAYVLATDDDSNGYPMSNLYFTSVSNKLDICITESYYNTDTVMTNGIVPLTITVKNNSLQICDAYNVRVHDQNGYIIADTEITSALEPGQTAEITLDVQISDRTKDIVLHVTADDSECVDVNRKNNTVYINILLNDLVLTYKDISKVDDDYIITVNIENQGINTITGITTALFEQNNNGNIINSVYIDELQAGDSIECKFLISSQYFVFTDDTDLISFYVDVKAECSELSYENNSETLIYSYEDITALQPDGDYTIFGTVTSYGDAGEVVTVTLYDSDGIEIDSNTTTDGTYTLSAPDGTYTLEVSKLNHVTREYEVVVDGDEVTQDVKIHLIGDINGDGKVNSVDKKTIYNHINEVNTIADEYGLKVADVNGDSKINSVDKKLIYNHINEISSLWSE